MVDGSNESLYHADEEMHPLVRTFSPSQTISQNLDAPWLPDTESKDMGSMMPNSLAQMEPKITNHSNKIVVKLSLSLFATFFDRLLLSTEKKWRRFARRARASSLNIE